jgi:hypothetical protein
MTRKNMIKFIVKEELSDLQMSLEIQDSWCEHVLLNGIKGLHDYTDDELKQKVKDLREGIKNESK